MICYKEPNPFYGYFDDIYYELEDSDRDEIIEGIEELLSSEYYEYTDEVEIFVTCDNPSFDEDSLEVKVKISDYLTKNEYDKIIAKGE